MFTRISCLLLALAVTARAGLKWDSTTVLTAAPPSKGPATAEFTFTNTGTYPIKIDGTRTSCGCTAAVVDQHIIPPGAQGRIHVSFKTWNRHGLYEEPIEIQTNDPAAKEITLTLRIMVKDAVELEPAFLFWQAGEPLTPKSLLVAVTEGYTVPSVTAAAADSRLEVRVETLKTGAEYKITVTPKSAGVRSTIAVTPKIEGQAQKVFTAHVRVG